MSAALTLEVISAGSDAQELERLAGQLRRDLLDLDVDDVRWRSDGTAPSGAKGLDPAAIGTLVVHTTQSAAALAAVVTTVRSWLGHHGSRTVKVAIGGDSIEVTGLSSEDQHRLIEQWIEGHANG